MGRARIKNYLLNYPILYSHIHIRIDYLNRQRWIACSCIIIIAIIIIIMLLMLNVGMGVRCAGCLQQQPESQATYDGNGNV